MQKEVSSINYYIGIVRRRLFRRSQVKWRYLSGVPMVCSYKSSWFGCQFIIIVYLFCISSSCASRYLASRYLAKKNYDEVPEISDLA